MRAWLPLPLLLSVAACDLVFAVEPRPDAGAITDADPAALVRFHIATDDVTTTITSTASMLDLDRSYVLVDDAIPPRRVELSEVGPGEYTAPVPPGAGFRLVRPDPVTGVLHVSELPARTQRWHSVFLGHRDETAATVNDTLDLNLIRDQATPSSCYLLVTGTWLAGAVPGCEAASDVFDPAPLGWSTLTSVSGRQAARPQPGDRVHLLRYAAGQVAGALVDVSPAFGPGPTALAGVFTPVNRDREINTSVIDHGMAVRLSSAEPAPSVGTEMQRWDVFALPAVPVVFSGPVLLSSRGAFSEGKITGTFANPFSWPAVLVVQHVFTRPTVVDGAVAVGSYTAATVYTDELGTPSQAHELHIDPAIPTRVVVAGTALASDDTMVSVGQGPIDVDVTIDGPTDMVLLTVSRADVLGGRLTFVPVLSASGVTTHFSIPVGALIMGPTYQIRVTTRRGVPGLADGDPGVGLPLAVAFHDSATFTLVP